MPDRTIKVFLLIELKWEPYYTVAKNEPPRLIKANIHLANREAVYQSVVYLFNSYQL